MSESCGKVTTKSEENKEDLVKRPDLETVKVSRGRVSSEKAAKPSKTADNKVQVTEKQKNAPENPIGKLNRPPSPTPVDSSLDTKVDSTYDALRAAVVGAYQGKTSKNGTWVGIVLAKVSNSREYKNYNHALADKKIDNHKIDRLKAYKIRIPEIHSHLEEPSFAPFDADESRRQEILISLHDTFVAEKEDTPEPTVGQKVKVRIDQDDSFTYLGPVENRTKASAIKTNTKGEAKAAFKKPPKKEPAQTPSKKRVAKDPVTKETTTKDNPKYSIVKVPVDYPRTPGKKAKAPPGAKDVIRSDLAERHAKTKEILNALGCKWHSSGSARGLWAKPKSSAMIMTSFHYTGTAIDLNNAAMSGWNLKTRENYVEMISGRRIQGPYQVWARTDTPQATYEYNGKVYKPQKVTIKKLIIPSWLKKQKVKKNYTGTFVNLTEIINDVMKFDEISSRTNWFKTGKPGMGGEYWHFDGRKTLGINKGMTWGDFLQTIFSLSQLKGKPTYATSKNKKFTGGGFYGD